MGPVLPEEIEDSPYVPHDIVLVRSGIFEAWIINEDAGPRDVQRVVAVGNDRRLDCAFGR